MNRLVGYSLEYLNYILSGLLGGVKYGVEHMSVVQWSVVGITSVALGFLLLRTQRI